MIEIPESHTIGIQATGVLRGRKVSEVVPPAALHKFAWYNGDPVLYHGLLAGREIASARGSGSFVELAFEGDARLVVSDGTNMRYYAPGELRPEKHQLLIGMDDGSFLVFTVAMYGGIYVLEGEYDNPYYRAGMEKPSPLSKDFDEVYFESIFKSVQKDISAKALLATEQRIPGLGNGVLQDILFRAKISPRRKMSAFRDGARERLFRAVNKTLAEMSAKGGRDTEKDLYGNPGGYKTVLSKNTYMQPCPDCGGVIRKEAYLGGSVYYCARCQE